MVTDKAIAKELLEQLKRDSASSVPEKPIIDFRVLHPYAETGLEYARNGRPDEARNFLAYLETVVSSPGWMAVANCRVYQDDAREVIRLKGELKSVLDSKTDARQQPEYAGAVTK